MVGKAESKIEMIPVRSTNIQAVGYDPKRNVLVVQFSEGRKYEYSNVTPDVYERLATAKSIGSAFNQIIRSNPKAFPYERDSAMQLKISATIDYDFEKAKFFLAAFDAAQSDDHFDKRSKSGGSVSKKSPRKPGFLRECKRLPS